MKRPGRYLVVGSGSIGRRHLRNLRQLRPDGVLAVLRRPDSTGAGPIEGCDEVLSSPDDALAFEPSAAVIASPAPFHAPMARRLLEAGVSVLIEKPLASSYGDALGLIDVARRSPAAALVGYNLRFEPGLQAYRKMIHDEVMGQVLLARGYVGQYLPDWRPDADYRTSVSGQADLGGGPRLELSHEVDLACWFFGVPDEVHCVGGRFSALEIDVEDAVELTLVYSDPARMVTLGLNFLERAPRRSFDIVGSEATLRWDGIARRITIDSQAGSSAVDHSGHDRNTAYLAELRHFLACAEQEEEPIVSIEDGLNVLSVIEAARKSMQTGRGVTLERRI